MTLCEPAASASVEYVATPEAFSVPVPKAVVPSLNVTVPVGERRNSVTVAVKVTLAPTTTEEADVVKTVALEAAATVTVTTVEVEARLRESPP